MKCPNEDIEEYMCLQNIQKLGWELIDFFLILMPLSILLRVPILYQLSYQFFIAESLSTQVFRTNT